MSPFLPELTDQQESQEEVLKYTRQRVPDTAAILWGSEGRFRSGDPGENRRSWGAEDSGEGGRTHPPG